MKKTECVLVKRVVQALSQRLGDGPMQRDGTSLSFEIRPEFGTGQCVMEGKLSYELPDSTAVEG
jgi:hypothetical protein